MSSYASLYALGPIVKKIPSSLRHLAEIVSYKYWRPEARQFRMARSEWYWASAHLRLLLDEIDESFERADNVAADIQTDLYDLRSSSKRAKKIGRKLDTLSQRLANMRKGAD